MAKKASAHSDLLAAVVAPFSQLRADRAALIFDPTAAASGAQCLIAEYHGARVDDVRQLKADVSCALERAALSARFELVRAGWLPTTPRGAVDAGKIGVKHRRMVAARRQIEILDGSFALLGEPDKDRFAYFGSRSKIRTPVEITYPGHITLGNWVSLGRYGKIVMLPEEAYAETGENLVAQHYPELVGTYDFTNTGKGRDANLYLGDGTTLGDHYFIICTKTIEFGKHVMTASNLFVSDCHHTYENTDIPPVLLPVTSGRPVRIGDHVWIGINCCILDGVTIGAHAVVAANSVVKDDVPPYTLVAGAPARVKKEFRPGTRS